MLYKVLFFFKKYITQIAGINEHHDLGFTQFPRPFECKVGPFTEKINLFCFSARFVTQHKLEYLVSIMSEENFYPHKSESEIEFPLILPK